MKAIISKIEDLGGIEPFNDVIIGGSAVLKKISPMCEKELEFFLHKFGGYIFKRRVVASVENNIPISSNGRISIGVFFDFGDHSTLDEIDELREQIPKEYLPFAEGEPGDLFLVNNLGEIFYWYHEGFEGNNLFKISNSFQDFLFNNVKIDHNDNQGDNREVISVRLDF
jgi:hypothetical protein